MQHYAEHANSVIQCILITASIPLPLSLSNPVSDFDCRPDYISQRSHARGRFLTIELVIHVVIHACLNDKIPGDF